MATEIVDDRPLPGIDDLLVPHLGEIQRGYEDPERTARAAENAILPLVMGVSAIGELITSAASNKDDPPSRETLSHVGFLLTAMGEMIRSLDTVRSNADFQRFDPGWQDFLDITVVGPVPAEVTA